LIYPAFHNPDTTVTVPPAVQDPDHPNTFSTNVTVRSNSTGTKHVCVQTRKAG